MKKVMILALCACLSLSCVLTSCGKEKGGSSDSSNSSSDSSKAEESSAPSESSKAEESSAPSESSKTATKENFAEAVVEAIQTLDGTMHGFSTEVMPQEDTPLANWQDMFPEMKKAISDAAIQVNSLADVVPADKVDAYTGLAMSAQNINDSMAEFETALTMKDGSKEYKAQIKLAREQFENARDSWSKSTPSFQ